MGNKKPQKQGLPGAMNAPKSTRARGNTIRGKQKKPAEEANRGQRERAALNRLKAFELRLQRKTYREIAAALRVSVKTAFEYVEGFWGELQTTTAENAEMVRAMELETLDQLESRWRPIALHPNLDVSTEEIRNGKPFRIEIADYDAGLKAVDRVLKIQERRARLLGLDAPVKVEGKVEHAHLTLEEMEQRMRDAEV